MGKVKKIIYITIGTLSLALGILGIYLPLLPTTPLLILTTFCYAKGSDKFYRWFTSTKLYKKHIESFVKTKSMTARKKIIILASVTALISIPIIFVNVVPMRIVLALVILGHYVYFLFFIKTVTLAEEEEMKNRIDIMGVNSEGIAEKITMDTINEGEEEKLNEKEACDQSELDI
ncbi:MAG: YbaN family protein [Christensenellaceae bacterium]|jgi:uncharacterized membrane protein YbaN (DUF454 family)|nr:YbaN family protein [Christensenellaceae bacterium]